MGVGGGAPGQAATAQAKSGVVRWLPSVDLQDGHAITHATLIW